MNPRKDKKVVTLWLTEEEKAKLGYFIEEQRAMRIGQIILDLDRRGDIEEK